MRTKSMSSRSMSTSGALLLCLSAGMLWSCADEPKQVKPTSRPYKGQPQTQTDTPTVENTEERGEDIRRVCSRKAQTSTDISRCWMEESERRGAKKFDVELKLGLLVSPEGKAQEVNVLNSTAEFKALEACVVEAVRGWNFPSGQTMAPAQCNFLLRPMM
jgi:hypothetical protein